MGHVKRLMSSLLLAVGLVLVFAGLSHALGFSVPAMAASVALIAALLYAGAVWFGGASAVALPAGLASVTVFDRDLQVVAGAASGTHVTQPFPAALRPAIEARCRAALRGESASFSCEIGGRTIAFDTAPIAAPSGQVLYGVLIAGTGPALPSLSPAAATAG
jgi:hypothetical protein